MTRGVGQTKIPKSNFQISNSSSGSDNNVSFSEQAVGSVNCFWLLNDDLCFRSSLLSKVITDQIRVVSINLKNLHGRFHRERLVEQNKTQKPCLLWIRLTGQATQTGTSQDSNNAILISLLVQTQRLHDGHVLLESSCRNPMLNQVSISSMIKSLGLNEGVLHWCNAGIVHPQSGKPSSVRIYCVTDVVLPFEKACVCGKPWPDQETHYWKRW